MRIYSFRDGDEIKLEKLKISERSSTLNIRNKPYSKQ
jgi:hypothetical protein